MRRYTLKGNGRQLVRIGITNGSDGGRSVTRVECGGGGSGRRTVILTVKLVENGS